jgi:hypothetical protein
VRLKALENTAIDAVFPSFFVFLAGETFDGRMAGRGRLIKKVFKDSAVSED